MQGSSSVRRNPGLCDLADSLTVTREPIDQETYDSWSVTKEKILQSFPASSAPDDSAMMVSDNIEGASEASGDDDELIPRLSARDYFLFLVLYHHLNLY